MANKKEFMDHVTVRMDTLEWSMKNNYHLKDPKFIEMVLDACVECWPFLSESDREFYEAARWAFNNKKRWTNNVTI